jgi:hypothetical protein
VVMVCCQRMLHPCSAQGPLPISCQAGATRLPGCALAEGKEGGGPYRCCSDAVLSLPVFLPEPVSSGCAVTKPWSRTHHTAQGVDYT